MTCCRPNTVRFVLGFSTASLFPETVAHQCQNFFYYCFLWISPGTSLDFDTHPTRAYGARSAAFAWANASNSATGVVLIEKFTNDHISSTEFRKGAPSTRPWGLFMPECPFCRVSHQVKAQHANNQRLNLDCDCGARASSVRQPARVEQVMANHYVYPFPCDLEDGITWKLGMQTLTGRWTSTPRSLRGSAPHKTDRT